MSETTSTHPAPTPAPTAPVRQASTPGGDTFLLPDQTFPTRLAELELTQVQMLHSRINRQLETEYHTIEGPHPVTLDRCEELREELDTRQHVLDTPTAGQ